MLEGVHNPAIGLAASDVRHGADRLQVVVRLSHVVVDPVVWYLGWWSPGLRDRRQVLKVCVHVVL